jgi:protein-S-isoprenylcysteine O-methyltransferase Ste14
MLQGILTGQTKGAVLLAMAFTLFVYFLPAFLAFVRSRRHFLTILILNALVSPAQAVAAYFLAPNLLAFDPHNLASVGLTAALISYGPGWLALLIWSLLPGEPDPRWLQARQTKTYDTIAALPLILWFTYGVLQLRALLAHDGAMIAAGTASLIIWMQFFSLLAALLFDLLLVYLLVVRDRPVAKSKGTMPRVFAVLGTFAGIGILQLPVAQLSLPTQMVAAVLIGVGSLSSFLVLWRLGKSFSIMPEARKLVTGGPYAYARHPLYAVEMISIVGTALQFAAPWSWIMAGLVVTLLWIRSYFEEQVLAQTYPEYEAYRAKTKRFIPGLL